MPSKHQVVAKELQGGQGGQGLRKSQQEQPTVIVQVSEVVADGVDQGQLCAWWRRRKGAYECMGGCIWAEEYGGVKWHSVVLVNGLEGEVGMGPGLPVSGERLGKADKNGRGSGCSEIYDLHQPSTKCTRSRC